MASKSKNSSKLKSLNWILWLAIGLLVTSIMLYFVFIFGLKDTEKANWGTFGDLIGGTLNPIFALFSLFAIIYTIKIQTEELELSREELKETKEELRESRIAQQEQSESLAFQNDAMKLQIFENTFFQLLSSFNEMRNYLTIEIRQLGETGIPKINNLKASTNYEVLYRGEAYSGIQNINSQKAISEYLRIFKIIFNYDYNLFMNSYENFVDIYFKQIYQIIKLVNDNTKEKRIDNPQRYINILRAQFTKDELEFLFYHCLGTIGQRHFKGYVEEYEFFEDISLNDDIEKQLLVYDINAFGKNERILEKYKELKSKTQ